MPLDDVVPADFQATEHFCMIYQSVEERLAGLVPFLHQGLVLGEKVVYIADGEQGREAISGLRRGVLMIGQYMLARQFEILPPETFHVSAEAFNPILAVEAIRSLADTALAEGRKGLRVAVEIGGIAHAALEAERLIQYETALDGLAASLPAQFMCLYDSSRFDSFALLSAFYNHPGVFVSGEPYDNFHFDPHGGNADLHAAVLRHSIGCLVEKRQVEEGIRHRIAVEESLAKVSKTLIAASGQDLTDALKTLAEAVAANRAYVLFMEGNGLRVTDTNEWCDDLTEPALHGQRGAATATRPWLMEKIRRGEDVVITDVDELPVEAEAEKAAFQARGARAMVLMPVRSPEGTLLGVIGFDDTMETRDWSSEDVMLLRVASEMIAAYLGRLASEVALKEAEERNTTVIENMRDMVFTLRTDGTVASVNHVFEDMTGFSREEWIGRKYESIVHGDDVALARRVEERVLAGEQVEPYELRLAAGDGSYKHAEIKVTPLVRGGKVVAIIGVARDITERKRAEEQIRNTANFLSSIIDQSPISTWIADAEGTNIRQNEACRRLLGIASDDETVGRYNLFRDPVLMEQGLMAEINKVFREGRTARFLTDYDFAKVDGVSVSKPAHVYLMVTIFPIKDASGKVINAVVQHEDMTERRQLEERLRQSQKMEAVGRLAGGVAHDFNNLLAAIMGYSDLVLAGMSPSDPLRSDVDEIKKAVDRATALTRQLLTFSRKQVLELKTVDLNVMIGGMEKMLRLLSGDSVRFECKLADDLGLVRADATQIEQVIMNLVGNARDAMPDGGWLTVATASVSLDEGQCRGIGNIPPGEYVMLSVADTGIGMDAETRSHIFEPFFTTKGRGKGTGLGLATVYGIVKQSGGGISVVSEPGKGTTMQAYLPRFRETVESPRPAGKPEVAKDGAGTVMLVEDEEIIREFVARLLSSRGYEVSRAACGAEALEILGNGVGEIGLLITDITMPGMNGRELADRVRDMRPEVKVLYISGFASNADLYRDDKQAHFLQKPFTSEALLREVEQLINQ